MDKNPQKDMLLLNFRAARLQKSVIYKNDKLPTMSNEMMNYIFFLNENSIEYPNKTSQ